MQTLIKFDLSLTIIQSHIFVGENCNKIYNCTCTKFKYKLTNSSLSKIVLMFAILLGPPVLKPKTCPVCIRYPCDVPCKCDKLYCEKDCPYGWEKDSRGCNTCECKPKAEVYGKLTLQFCRYKTII